MGFKVISFLVLFLIVSPISNSQTAIIDFPVTIIGNDVGARSMTQRKVKDCFKGKYIKWPNKNAVLLVLPSSKHPKAELYSELLYNKSYYFVKKYWYSLVFQGRYSAPFFFDSDAEIIEFISKNKGAIGMISNDKDISIEQKIMIVK